MKFVKMLDLGNAQEVAIDGLGAIELVTPNILRCQYYTSHEVGQGDCRNRLAVSLRWDYSRFLFTWEMLRDMGPARLLDALPIIDIKPKTALLRTN